MNLLAFSDIHRDTAAIDTLAPRARAADLLVGAGDFATMRAGLQPVIDAIAALDRPTVLVHGNSESEDELRDACRAHRHLHVLHGSRAEVAGVTLFGLGAAVPVTPFGDWSVDLTEKEAARLLDPCPEGCVLVSHSPPRGHCDTDSAGRHLGSRALLACVKKRRPTHVLCGHVHASWGAAGRVGPTLVHNLGPAGLSLDLS